MSNICKFGPKKEKEEEVEGCVFCHPRYTCYVGKFETLSCPRIAQISFLGFEEAYDGWWIQAVQFRDYIFEGEVDLEGDQEDE